MVANLYIVETNLRIYTQFWVDWRRFVSLFKLIQIYCFFPTNHQTEFFIPTENEWLYPKITKHLPKKNSSKEESLKNRS